MEDDGSAPGHRRLQMLILCRPSSLLPHRSLTFSSLPILHPRASQLGNLLAVPAANSIERRSLLLPFHAHVKVQHAINQHEQNGAPLRERRHLRPGRPRPLELGASAVAALETELVLARELAEFGGPGTLAAVRIGGGGEGYVNERGGRRRPPKEGGENASGHCYHTHQSSDVRAEGQQGCAASSRLPSSRHRRNVLPI